MSLSGFVLGLDAGSVSLSAVIMDFHGRIIQKEVTTHGGDICSALEKLSRSLNLNGVQACAVTGQNSSRIHHNASYDSSVSCIEWVKHRYPGSRAILLVGGEKFSLIRFDSEGHYRNLRTNTSCAAGTGSFLDQQAGRLNLNGSAELSRIAYDNSDPVPLVATRCAVFAKTDLIHAQQEGFSLSGISEGLCKGLARNLVDTLFKDKDLSGPVLFTGGVSQNQAVLHHLRELVKQEIVQDPLGLFQGAAGAALLLLKDIRTAAVDEKELFCPETLAEFYKPEGKVESDYSPPLELKYSDYPDFSSYRSWDQSITGRPGQPFVEVDLYKPWPKELKGYLGIDIGSTSTKGVVTDLQGSVYGGFYTRTSGRPMEAVQALFEAIRSAAEKESSRLMISGSGTTGSGRKFIGRIIGADVILDEISAHARAACELDPQVDTILEIGGQDAKFTTLRNRRVTLSVMNNVCAAGTGSFLEEQGAKLGVPIRSFADLTYRVSAPGVSDRCTVFMERDINHLISEGASVPEVLASALHAVRENYLRKVAVEKHIGERIFFQGATAKNRSLVAAFEQKLQKPILVSPYCHLTGALGAALSLVDEKVRSRGFIGLDFYRKSVPVRREVCRICTNHCKLTIADLGDRSEAFGFLCGRDYDSKGYVNRNLSGWDLQKERRKGEARILEEAGIGTGKSSDCAPVIGIPEGLYLTEDRLYWEVFFRELGFRVKSGGVKENPIKIGKPFTGAEFCAPVSAFHGHALTLLDSCDYLFLPVYLENKPGKKGELRKYCYFSQFSSSLVHQQIESDRILSPVAATRYSIFQLIGELYKSLSDHGELKRTVLQIRAALEKADMVRSRKAEMLKELYKQNKTADDQVDVLLMGRPYTVLPSNMNKGIPEIFGSLGIRVFYQDMLEYDQEDIEAISPLLEEVNWNYGARILESAEMAARTPGLYPVIISSFKCGPDSFVIEYVRKILDQHDKPYLILELDEHDSSVGYETRIEAAVRSFQNHLSENQRSDKRFYQGINPDYETVLPRLGKLVMPNWDDYAVPLLASILTSQGYETFVMEESEQTIRRSLKWNNGQCIPMNAIAEGYASTVEAWSLNPEETRLWIPSANFSCNIKMFPHHIQELLKNYGGGLEKSKVYLGQMSFVDLSPMVTANAYLAFMFSGLIRRIACRIRPYELNPGQTDQAVQQAIELLKDLFSRKAKNKDQGIDQVLELFEWIPYDKEAKRPKVALFGDVYVRDNPVMNQDLIHFIEANGGEVVTMPYHEYTRMTVDTYFRRWTKEMKFGRLLKLKPIMAALSTMEKWYYRHFERVLDEPMNRYDDNAESVLGKFGVTLDHEGESQDNLLKTWYLSRQYPDLSLFVQMNPGFCCAGLVTEAMARKIRDVTGVPVLSITYDGTGGAKNDAVIPYLKYPSAREKQGISRKSG